MDKKWEWGEKQPCRKGSPARQALHGSRSRKLCQRPTKRWRGPRGVAVRNEGGMTARSPPHSGSPGCGGPQGVGPAAFEAAVTQPAASSPGSRGCASPAPALCLCPRHPAAPCRSTSRRRQRGPSPRAAGTARASCRVHPPPSRPPLPARCARTRSHRPLFSQTASRGALQTGSALRKPGPAPEAGRGVHSFGLRRGAAGVASRCLWLGLDA